jgi:hypothetical protein
MKEEFFTKAKRDIESAGIRVLEAEYRPEISKSWHIIVENDPLLRISWDGESCWFVLEEELRVVTNGPRIWKDIWIGENPDSRSIDRVVGILIGRCRGEIMEIK